MGVAKSQVSVNGVTCQKPWYRGFIFKGLECNIIQKMKPVYSVAAMLLLHTVYSTVWPSEHAWEKMGNLGWEIFLLKGNFASGGESCIWRGNFSFGREISHSDGYFRLFLTNISENL